MKCNFCGREVPKGTEECPYCHYRFEQEATILNPRERDEFEGVTIDESGYEENAAGNNGTRSPNTGRLMNTAAKNTAVRAAAEALKFTLKTLAAAVGCLPLCWLSAY